MSENNSPPTLTPLQIETSNNSQALAIQYYRAGNYRDALAHCISAVEIDQTNVKLLNLTGAIAGKSKEPATAVYYLKKSLALVSQQPEALFLLGNTLSEEQKYDESSEFFKELLTIQPENIDTLVNLGLCMDKLGKPAKLEQYLKKALNLAPNHPEANNALAILFNKKKRHDKALIHARAAVNEDPHKIEYFLTLGSTLHQLNDHDEAVQIFQTALRLHNNNPSVLCELAGALYKQGNFDAAEKQYEKALKLAPKQLSILARAAAFYQNTRKSKKALKIYKRYIELHPDDIGMNNNLGIVYRDLEMFEEAEVAYIISINMSGNSTFVYNNLAILSMEMGKPEESIDYYAKVLDIDPTYWSARSNMLFYMNYLSKISSEEIYKAHIEWSNRHALPLLEGEIVHGNDITTDRKLRIGYITADFYGHAVSYFIEAALKNHDTEKFDIYCYAAVATPDLTTKRFRSYNNTWRDIHPLKTMEIVDLIREDKIDILVDLSGHTAGHKLIELSMKPAPVQVTWIGYPNTTGLKTVDYRFVDKITDPVGLADKIHTEKLWRLPRCFTCYTKHSTEPTKSKIAARENGYITFGSFNNSTKISDSCVSLWARILKRVKNSRLILKSASLGGQQTQDRFIKLFKKYGIDKKRISMFARMPSQEHLRFYDKIDICLDSYPYHGTTTSCEALAMGTPIITLMGDRHAARVTGSLLSQVNLGYLAGETEEECIELAATLASDIDKLEEISLGLRKALEASPLCDEVGHTREVEDAYTEMWKIWSSEEPARRLKRKKLGHSETSPHKPSLGLIHSFNNTTITQFFKCLGSMKNTMLISELHPLGMNIFSPIRLAQKYFNLFTDEEIKILTQKKFEFDSEIVVIQNRVAELGGNLVISNWNHLDFIAQPYLPTPDFELHTPKYLEKRFDLKSLFIVTHPLSQWIFYLKNTTIGDLISIEEFLQGYRHFAEEASKGKFFKIEDLVIDPDTYLKEICKELHIPFDQEYADNWPFYSNIESQIRSNTIEEKAIEEISLDVLSKNELSYRERMEPNPDYQKVLKLLGYESNF